MAAVLALTGTVTACSSSGGRWCEHDATDTRVADRYCEQNVPGYEWEGGGKSKKKNKAKHQKGYKQKY